jgi:hypothetical protein
MFYAGRRPMGRLFYWLVAAMVAGGILASAPVAPASGVPPQSGPAMTSVVEVRAHDYGWGQANDRNLLGRFNTQTFTLPRLARTQNYFLRMYDSSSPPRYSRYAAALHVDYPL